MRHGTRPSRVRGLRACRRQHLGHGLPNPWVDVDHLCAVTHEQVRARALDDWMAARRARQMAKSGTEAGRTPQKPGGLMSRLLGRVVN